MEPLGLKDVKLNINLQKTGEGKWYHLDGMGSYTKEKNVEQEEKYASVFAMLTDWMPGQWLIFGNTTWEKWRAGECAYYDWEHIPHGTANFSHGHRWLLKIRGIKTPEFNKLIGG